MSKSAALLLLLAGLPLAAQDGAAQKFAGTWEAKFKDQVICTMRIKAAGGLSGESADCNINVDANGDLQEPDNNGPRNDPSPMLKMKINGDVLSFEEKEDDDTLRFEFKILSDGQGELRLLDPPMPIKPVHFTRRSG